MNVGDDNFLISHGLVRSKFGPPCAVYMIFEIQLFHRLVVP